MSEVFKCGCIKGEDLGEDNICLAHYVKLIKKEGGPVPNVDNLNVVGGWKMKASSTGGLKADPNKRRVDLLDIRALEGIADVLGYGSKKYGDRNWEKGIEWSRVYGAALRHLMAMWAGEDLDSETGLPHIDHAATNLMFLQRFFRTHKNLDDRPKQQPTIGGSSATPVGGSLAGVDGGAQVSTKWNVSIPATSAPSEVGYDGGGIFYSGKSFEGKTEWSPLTVTTDPLPSTAPGPSTTYYSDDIPF